MKEEIIILGTIAGIIIYYEYMKKTKPITTDAPVIGQTPVPTRNVETVIKTETPNIEQTPVSIIKTETPTIEQTPVSILKTETPEYTMEKYIYPEPPPGYPESIRTVYPMPAQMPYQDYEIITRDKKIYLNKDSL